MITEFMLALPTRDCYRARAAPLKAAEKKGNPLDTTIYDKFQRDKDRKIRG